MMELGWPLPRRKEYIQRLKSEPTTRTYSLNFQGQRQELPRHPVPIGLPKYRLDNGRTRSAQVEWLALHPDLPKDFFSKDLESDAAQSAQHKILVGMLGHGERELLRYFRKHEQTDPLILTELGFVLNGNRRLCAMRELIQEDKATYTERFGHPDVVILPPADERELDRLEARLQITADIKAEYSWTAKAFMLRSRRDEHKFDDRELSALYEIPLSDVRELLDMLSLAENYLEDRNKTRQFKLIDKSEFAFRQLKRGREKLKSEPDKQVFQKLSYSLIDAPDEGQGRLYAAIPDIAKYLPEIVETIREEIDVGSSREESQAARILGVKPVKVDPLIQAIENEKNVGAVRGIIADVVEAEKFKSQQHKRGTQAAAALAKASELISTALAAWKTASSKKKVADQVAILETQMKKLRARLDADRKN